VNGAFLYAQFKQSSTLIFFSRGLHIASKLINDSNLSMKIEPLIAVSVEWSGKWTVKKVTEYGAMLIL